MKFVLIINLALILLLVPCCHNGKKQPFVQDIAKDILRKSHNGLSPMEGMNILRDTLKLDTLQHGYKLLQIRMWIKDVRDDTTQVIVIKKTGAICTGEVVKYYPVLSITGPPFQVLYYRQTKYRVVPKMPWENFVAALQQHDIITLPHWRNLCGYDLDPNANFVTFEIATENIYRVYSYGNPGMHQNFAEARLVSVILSLIQQQFQVQLKQDF